MSAPFDDDTLQESLAGGMLGPRKRPGLGTTLLQQPAVSIPPAQAGLGAQLMSHAGTVMAPPFTPAPAASGYPAPQAAEMLSMADTGIPSATAGQAQDNAKPVPFDVDKAVQYLDDNALPQYIDGKAGHCGKAVRLAIGAGGRDIGLTQSAKDYGPKLTKADFTKLDVDGFANYTPRKGDVIIYPAWGKHKDGHMQMYDGTQWVSDFKQHGGDGRYPGGDPRWKDQVFSVYRP